jgi:GNAT superfamily N-acetyltransferase
MRIQEMDDIHVAEDEQSIARCFPVMAQLRPHIASDAFASQVQRQRESCGYRLAYAIQADQVVAVAGFRVTECLAWGKFLYVDDLVTDDACRSAGWGKRLLDWLINRAREEGCDQLHLDSGVQRFEAHRFYLRERMNFTSHHFAIDLRPNGQ